VKISTRNRVVLQVIRALLAASLLLPAAASRAGILGFTSALAHKHEKQACTGHGIELQVLGSGGPEMQDKRASSSYLIWRDGKARVLIDAGGGAALRFGEAGATMSDLDLVLFTHFHADHSADFPALVKSSYFEERKRALPVFGPPGSEFFPSANEFVQALFDKKSGAYRYLSEFLKGGDGAYKLQTQTVSLAPAEVKQVFAAGGITATATPVIHGAVPALAWRVDLDGARIAFSGDSNGNNGNLEHLAENADIFVAHNAVPEGVTGVERALHMPPSVIGNVAAKAKVKSLVLSHRMLRTLGKEEQTRLEIEKGYQGQLVFAEDLDCFAVGK
jgi:ribonuclease BN (tRNA processing enzyme)